MIILVKNHEGTYREITTIDLKSELVASKFKIGVKNA